MKYLYAENILQDYSNYRGDDGWDETLSLLPGQASDRFNERDRRQSENQRFPHPRFGTRGPHPRFRGPRPHQSTQDQARIGTHTPRQRFPSKPVGLMDIRTRGPRPALHGVNSKLMNISNENGSDSIKSHKLDSKSFNINKPGISGMRGSRPNGPRHPIPQGNSPRPRSITPLLEESKPYPSHQDRFPRSKTEPSQQHGGKRSIGNDSMEVGRKEGLERTGWLRSYCMYKKFKVLHFESYPSKTSFCENKVYTRHSQWQVQVPVHIS